MFLSTPKVPHEMIVHDVQGLISILSDDDGTHDDEFKNLWDVLEKVATRANSAESISLHDLGGGEHDLVSIPIEIPVIFPENTDEGDKVSVLKGLTDLYNMDYTKEVELDYGTVISSASYMTISQTLHGTKTNTFLIVDWS